MKRIFKYPVEMVDDPKIAMPRGALVLSVQAQGDMPQVWALVDDQRPLETRSFKLRGTGHAADDVEGSRFIGTFQMKGGALVFHLFEG